MAGTEDGRGVLSELRVYVSKAIRVRSAIAKCTIIARRR